jgi:transposase
MQTRVFRSVPFGLKPTCLQLDVQRVECRDCRAVRQVKLAFADEKRTYTRAFERYVLALLRFATVKDVAGILGVGWDMIKDIQKRNLTRRFGRPKLKHLRRIAIDEICIGHGHKYLTVVLDLDRSVVVFVGNGKSSDSLKPFWKRLRASSARIQAVAIDMSQAYQLAVREHLPHAILVFDRFHVVKLFNEKLSDFRRRLQRECQDHLQRTVLKGTRWLLLKNPENLDDKRNEKERLAEALRLNEPLATVYYMKEDLRQFWCQTSRREAGRFLRDWRARAESSGIPMLAKFAETLRQHQEGLLNYYRVRITTGPLEGINNKIKTMQRQCYGLRDSDYFKLRILGLHVTRHALVG